LGNRTEENIVTNRWAAGTGVCMLVAAVAYGLKFVSPVFDPLVTGILLGVIVANLSDQPSWIENGADRCIAFALPGGIALYGFQLKIHEDLRQEEIAIVVAAFVVLYLATTAFSRISGLRSKTTILLSTGMAVCGASAIAVVSPAIKAKKHETSVAVLAVMVAGLLYTLVYPALTELAGLSDPALATLSGATLPMLGLVKVAVSSLDPENVDLALRIKFLRIASLVFMVTVAVTFSGIRERRLRIPWFMALFIAFTVYTNMVGIPGAADPWLGHASSFLLTLTLSGIGLRTSLESVARPGLRPFAVTFLSLGLTALTVVFLRGAA